MVLKTGCGTDGVTAQVLVQGLQLQHEVVAGVAEVAVEGRGHPVPVCHPWS